MNEIKGTNIYFYLSSASGILAIIFQFYVNPYSDMISISMVSISIYFRIISVNISKRSTGIENISSDRVIAFSAVIWFVLMEAIKWVIFLVTMASFLTFLNTILKIIVILILILVIGLISNNYINKRNRDYKEFRKTLRLNSTDSNHNLLQKYRRYINAALGVPFFLAILPNFIMLPLNLLLSFPLLLRSLNKSKNITEKTVPFHFIWRIVESIDIEERLWSLADSVAESGKGQLNIWLPLNLLIPSFFYGYFNPFATTSYTLIISYTLMLLPGFIMLFFIDTRILPSDSRGLKRLIYIISPFYALLLLSLFYPNSFLLQFPIISSLQSLNQGTSIVFDNISTKLSFIILFFFISYFVIIGLVQSLAIFAEERNYNKRRQIVHIYQYFFIPYISLFGLIFIFYLNLESTAGLIGSIFIFLIFLVIGIFGSSLFVRLKAGWR